MAYTNLAGIVDGKFDEAAYRRQFPYADISSAAMAARKRSAEAAIKPALQAIAPLSQSSAVTPEPPFKADLLKTEKSSELNAALRNTFPALNALSKSVAATTKAIQDRQNLFNPLIQSSAMEDVAEVTGSRDRAVKRLVSAKDQADELEQQAEALGVKEAAGMLERYGAGNPYQGLSSEALRIVGEAATNARLPYALNRARLTADLGKDIYNVERGTQGQRLNLLNSAYSSLQNQTDDAFRPLGAVYGALGQAGNVFENLNFLGLGGRPPAGSFPIYNPIQTMPSVGNYYRPPSGVQRVAGGVPQDSWRDERRYSPPPQYVPDSTAGPSAVEQAYYRRFGIPYEADSDFTPERWRSVGGTISDRAYPRMTNEVFGPPVPMDPLPESPDDPDSFAAWRQFGYNP